MNTKNIFSKLKVFESVRVFVNNYSYKEMEIKKVDGVFLENRSSEWQIIRISDQKFATIEEFNKDMELLLKVKAQFQKISGLNKVKMLCIYFAGEIVEEVEDIHSVVINSNVDTKIDDILSNSFPLLQKVNYDQIDQIVSANEANVKQGKAPIIQTITADQLRKNNRFTRWFLSFFIIINALAMFVFPTSAAINYQFSYYSVFFDVLKEFYRPLTSILVNNNILYILCFVMFFFRYNVYIEFKLGTFKTAMVYIISMVITMLSMIFLLDGSVIAGSLPLAAALVGAYCGVISMPSERDLLFNHLYNMLSMIFLFLLVASLNYINLETAIIAFLSGFASVIALNIKKKPINKPFIGILGLVAVFIISAGFIPNPKLARNSEFEKGYVTYVNSLDKKQGQQVENTLDKYYKEIGAVDYE